MAVLRRSVGDKVLAGGKPGVIVGFWRDNPEFVIFPYYVDILGGESAQLYSESELKDYPESVETSVWESMAYAYWEKWRETDKELQLLRGKIKELIKDAST